MEIVVYGNGAMARVFYSYARHSMQIAGFTVDDDYCKSEEFCGLPLSPFSRVEERFSPDRYLMMIAVGYVEMNRLRERKYREGLAKGYGFSRFVHPSVTMHDGVEIEGNCIVLDYVSIHPGCRIGQGTFISSNVNIGHDCDIGEYNWINSGVAFGGGCKIGTGCFFGVNSSTAQNVHLGKKNFIAANTVINRNTGDDEVYLSPSAEKFRLKSEAFLKFSGLAG